MTWFTRTIVRRPSRSMIDGLTTKPELGTPDYEKALKQHDDYIKALMDCGVEVTILPAIEELPDSCFVEGTTVITPKGAIFTNIGAGARKAETAAIEPVVRRFFDDDHIAYIKEPGNVDGGDVMMVGDHFYIGRSARTNEEGIRQFIEILESWGLSGEMVPLNQLFHLKGGVCYLENNNLNISGECLSNPQFKDFNHIEVEQEENYATNCIWVNGKVIVPAGFPKVLKDIQAAGYETIVVDTSEFRKLDGAPTCLSLRF